MNKEVSKDGKHWSVCVCMWCVFTFLCNRKEVLKCFQRPK